MAKKLQGTTRKVGPNGKAYKPRKGWDLKTEDVVAFKKRVGCDNLLVFARKQGVGCSVESEGLQGLEAHVELAVALRMTLAFLKKKLESKGLLPLYEAVLAAQGTGAKAD